MLADGRRPTEPVRRRPFPAPAKPPGTLRPRMSTASPRRPLPWLLQAPDVPDVHAPAWFHRRPTWLTTGAIVLILLAISALVRSRFITGQLWADEANRDRYRRPSPDGDPGHPAPERVRSALLHAAARLDEPVRLGRGGDAPVLVADRPAHRSRRRVGGWSLFGRRAGMAAGVLFAFSPFLTHYAEEVQPYELLALLGLLATACFLHGFVRRRRGYLVGLALALCLSLYTSFWAIFLWGAMAVALCVPAPHGRRSPGADRRDAATRLRPRPSALSPLGSRT